jgi:7-cyano-7-deazaguanine synthase
MKKLLIASMSGGLDSATLVAQALKEGFTIQPITFEYGQKNYIEKVAQQRLEDHFQLQYPELWRKTISIDITKILNEFISQYQIMRDTGEILEKTGEAFYTPSRNLLFMVLSGVIGEIISLAEGFETIALGLGIHKHSTENYKKDYWDITPEFAYRLEHLLELNDSVKISIYSPFKEKYKSDIIAKAQEIGLPIYLTWSCYDPIKKNMETTSQKTIRYEPCHKCEACLERASQAKKIGIYDINNYSIDLIKVNIVD